MQSWIVTDDHHRGDVPIDVAELAQDLVGVSAVEVAADHDFGLVAECWLHLGEGLARPPRRRAQHERRTDGLGPEVIGNASRGPTAAGREGAIMIIEGGIGPARLGMAQQEQRPHWRPCCLLGLVGDQRSQQATRCVGAIRRRSVDEDEHFVDRRGGRVGATNAAMTTSVGMPAAFIGHGSPMNALERNDYTTAWRSFGTATPRPRAIVVVSAHWYINATAVTAMSRPRTIHDFYGFPDELFAVRYPAPGDPDLAGEIVEIVAPTWVGLDHDSWGIDHGAWSVLVHAYPDAEIPVLQLSINALKPFEYHLELGARLAPLRERGVLIVASGNVVHNLRRIDWNQPTGGFDWSQRFDEAARDVMTSNPGDAVALREHRDYPSAVPTPDHFLPLLYLAGLAAAGGSPADVLVDGYAYGSLSMTCYTLGGPPTLQTTATGEAAALPDPSEVAPDESNI